jgi:pantothenate kinase
MDTAAGVDLYSLVAAIEHRADKTPRLLVAIAGPPGGGKSTLADALAARLGAVAPGVAAVLPMDGYHYDDAVLIARGLRARKGAPETFDVAGFGHMLARLKRNAEPEIAVPVFDRDLEIARAGARLIPQAVRTLIVEGNYLLLDQAPWTELHAHFDLTVLLREPEAVLRARLTARWEGYRLPAAEVAAKVEGNDLPNGRLVLANSVAPDILLGN